MFNCTFCRKSIAKPEAGKFGCSRCGAIFDIAQDGKIFVVKPGQRLVSFTDSVIHR